MMFRALLVAISSMFGALALTLPADDAPRVPDRPAAPVAETPVARLATQAFTHVAAAPAALRTAPMASAALIPRIVPGGRVELIGASSGGWVEVRLADGATGFVRQEWLTALSR